MMIKINKQSLSLILMLMFFPSIIHSQVLPREEIKEVKQLSSDQVRHLSLKIMENTPEHIHYSKSTIFTWVLLSEEIKQNPKSLQEEVIKELSKKYTVYLNEKDVPGKLIKKNNNGDWLNFIGGFLFSFHIEFEKNETIKVYYGDWEGVLAASSHWTRYRWSGSDWRIIEKGKMIVS